MKKLGLAVLIGAAVALAACSQTMAQGLSQPEIHQFFGPASLINPGNTTSPTLLPTDLTTNPVVTALPGQTVYLPVFIRLLQGDRAQTGGSTRLSGYTWESHGAGNTSSFTAAGALLKDWGYPVIRPPANGDLTPSTVAGTGIRYYQFMGAATTSTTGLLSSDGAVSGAPFDTQGSYYLGYESFTVAAGAALGDTLQIWMNTPRGGTGSTTNRYSLVATSVASQNTIAFGADATGNPDIANILAPANETRGTLANQFTATPDAVIHVIPEPGTIGLIAVGVLAALRTRRRS